MSRIDTSVRTIKSTVSVCIRHNLTFAAWRLPNQKEQSLLIQKEGKINTISDLSGISRLKGFLVAPFLYSEKHPTFLINPDFYLKGEVHNADFEKIKRLKNPEIKEIESTKNFEVSKKEYLKQIDSITEAIRAGIIQKAVLSRIKFVKGQYTNKLPELFSKLCDIFPNAFVYMFRAGNHLWMGATPEPLVYYKDQVLESSAVAGTKEYRQKYQDLKNWGEKEKQEQQFVSDHIHQTFENNKLREISHFGPYIKQAGNLLHLRTDFSTRVKPVNGSLGHLITSLHPTPAVCGFETEEALELIRTTEKHDREYYSGFLGPVGLEDEISLFVNLRCMRITKERLSLFSGGGITIDSVPKDEWYETEIKAGTLLSVIKTIK